MAKVRPGRRMGLMAALVALAMLGGGMAEAHQALPGSGQPEAALQAAPTIALINPSNYGNRIVISDRTDVDERYHLVASVGNPPPGAIVEFEINFGSGNPLTLLGRRVGPNTWEAFVSLEVFLSPIFDIESVTVKAILYSGVNKLAEDSVTAEVYDGVASADDVDFTLPETVEILYPSNGGGLGLFDPPGATRAGFVVEATTSSYAPNSVLPFTTVGYLFIYYTVTPYGQRPVWKQCAQVSVPTSLFVRTGCRLLDGDAPSAVTGVAAITNDTPTILAPQRGAPLPVNRDQSGDAHVVLPYEQAGVRLSLSPTSQTGTAGNACVSFTAELLDQVGRPVWGANIDAHARGPSDALNFSSALQAPDGHDREQAWNCTSSFAGAQGEHNIPGAPDVKHSEGTTDLLGKLSIPLRSPQTGATDVIVWHDVNDNEVLDDALEPTAGASIQWLSGTLPTPEPSDVVTPSPQPSPAPTQTQPGPSPTQTQAPSPTSSPSPVASPTPRLVGRQVSAEANAQRIRFGQSFTLSGRVVAEQGAPPGCTSAVQVHILADRLGDRDGFEQIDTVTSDAQGNFSATIRPEASANYAARVAPTAVCDEATSATEPVLVKKVVRLRAAKPSVKQGNRVKLTAQVFPCQGHVGDVVVLQRLGDNGRFGQIKSGKLNQSCRASFAPRVFKNSVFRAKAPKTDPDHLGSKSNRVRVRARR